jgi:uncharacterized integral membrane protein
LTNSETQTEDANTVDTPLVGVLLAGLIAVALVAFVVVGVRVRRSRRGEPAVKTEQERSNRTQD